MTTCLRSSAVTCRHAALDENTEVRRLRYPKGQIEAALQKAKQLRKDGPVVLEAADVEKMEVVL